MFDGMNVPDALSGLGLDNWKDVCQLAVNLVVAAAAAWKTTRFGWKNLCAAAGWAGSKLKSPPEPEWAPGPVAQEMLHILEDPKPSWDARKRTLRCGLLTVWLNGEMSLVSAFLGDDSTNNLLNLMGARDFHEVWSRVREVVGRVEEEREEYSRQYAVEQLKRAQLEARAVLPLPRNGSLAAGGADR